MTQTKPKPEQGGILPMRRMICAACGNWFEQVWNPRKIRRLCEQCRRGKA